ncbi:MAG: prephenate dehydratase domain-containing protein [Chloroflexota bacterium]
MIDPTVTYGRIVFPGEPGSFAEDAALAYFGGDAPSTTCPVRGRGRGRGRGTSRAGCRAHREHRVRDRAAGPGPARRVGCDRRGRVIVPVRLCLAALPGKRLEDIERVYSHVQALGQSETFLRSRRWSLLAATNTAGSGR